MTIQDITEILDNKIMKNENKVVITFYEIRVKNNLNEDETNTFLELCRTRLKNLHYQVFFTGEQYVYENSNKIVQPNELMVAIKD